MKNLDNIKNQKNHKFCKIKIKMIINLKFQIIKKNLQELKALKKLIKYKKKNKKNNKNNYYKV